MTPRIYILGSGVFAKELFSYFSEEFPRLASGTDQMWPSEKAVQRRIIKFVDDDMADTDPEILTQREYERELIKYPGKCSSIMGSGKCEVKLVMDADIQLPFLKFIHSRAWVSEDAEIGGGCVIGPNAVVAPKAFLHRHVLVNYGATIGHDTNLGKWSVVSPNASIGGNCTIGDASYIGAGAMIKEGITVGQRAIVGMGAVVIKDVPDGATVVGVPAEPM
jgi:sugar O-acyltransferase (sialic acid O-acetyltransferase NeuD family)